MTIATLCQSPFDFFRIKVDRRRRDTTIVQLKHRGEVDRIALLGKVCPGDLEFGDDQVLTCNDGLGPHPLAGRRLMEKVEVFSNCINTTAEASSGAPVNDIGPAEDDQSVDIARVVGCADLVDHGPGISFVSYLCSVSEGGPQNIIFASNTLETYP